MFDLKGKQAVIIGGSGHLCSTLGKALRESGASVTIVDLAEPRFEWLDSKSTDFLKCDVTAKQAVFEARDEILKRHGRVDILLNGATANAPTPFFKITEDEIQRILAAN